MLAASVYNYLSSFFNQSIQQKNISFVGGGSIHQTFQLSLPGNKTFFCKINSATKFPHLFEQEKSSLEVLAATQTITTPKVIDCVVVEDHQLLILEWIRSGAKTKMFWSRFGEQLAALHSVTTEHYGYNEDNYMGSVPQVNTKTKEWIDFFFQHRIRPLLKYCLEKDLLSNRHMDYFEKLFPRLPKIFPPEKPALLHGDLWSGNYMCNQNEKAVLIDPAVYYGHRSADLGMTTLFGGFDQRFYEAYHYRYPLPVNYEEQWEVCNLYPLLIHLRLFGRSYLFQMEAILKKYQ